MAAPDSTVNDAQAGPAAGLVVPDPLCALAAAPTRKQIERFEAHLLQHPQVDIKVESWFADGLYVRQITIPRDTLMTGKVHLHEHVSVMVRGDMTVLTEHGMQRIDGNHVFIAKPGTKRVGYSHEETVWLTVHANPNGLTDVAAVEAWLVEPWTPLPIEHTKEAA